MYISDEKLSELINNNIKLVNEYKKQINIFLLTIK